MVLKESEFSLEDKYRRGEGSIILSGVQALVRLPLDQHRADRRRGLDTATLVSGYRGSPPGRGHPPPQRHPTPPRPAHAPLPKSSTIPTHSEVAFYDALFPVLFPGTIQEILDLGRLGFELSRYSGLWVGFKIVTNIADEVGTAEVA